MAELKTKERKMNIIELAVEAGIIVKSNKFNIMGTAPEAIERFATLVAAHERNKYLDKLAEAIDLSVKAEREACAEVCDRFAENETGFVAEDCAAAIRARGEK